MTENRNEKLLNGALRYIVAHIPGEEAYRFLHSQMGISNEELMQYGLNDLREYFQYEWEEGTLWREFADQMDRLLPQPDVHTTSAWISFASELADGVEASFVLEANKLLSAFREIAGNFSPNVVDTVYQVVLVPNNSPQLWRRNRVRMFRRYPTWLPAVPSRVAGWTSSRCRRN